MKHNILTSCPDKFRKWDTIIYPGGINGLIIKIDGTSIRVVPWNKSKWKTINFIKINWIKLKVFLKLV